MSADERTQADDASPEVVVVGAGFAGTCAALTLARRGHSVVVIDRSERMPDLFRAEKLEPDQAEIMRDLDLLQFRSPSAEPLGVISNFDGNEITPFDTGEQYGISYSETVNELRAHLPDVGARMIIDRAEAVHASEAGPLVELADGRVLRPRLVVVATGETARLARSLELSRSTMPELVSLSFGFDIESCDTGFDFTGFNYFLPPNPERVDYLTLFRIGERMRANLFTQMHPKDPLVRELKESSEAALHRLFEGLERHTGAFRVSTTVQVVPTIYYRVRDPARPGVVLIGDAFQNVSPTTGKGISRVLTDVAVLCNDHAPGWLESARSRVIDTRGFYKDARKRRSDERARASWVHYHERMQGRSSSLAHRVLRKVRSLTRSRRS